MRIQAMSNELPAGYSDGGPVDVRTRIPHTTEMLPSVGRIIHVTADLATDQTDCLAAIITRVNPDGTIHATLFAPIGPMADAAKRLPPLPRESWHDPRH